MQSLYTCIVEKHDLPMVIAAAVVCVVGAYATFDLGVHAFFSRRTAERWLWGAACVVASATSTWVTHFVAMLAFHPGAASGFDPGLTAASFGVAVLLIGAGVVACITRRTRTDLLVGGAVVGLGISAMHYLGMAAYEVAGAKAWDLAAVGASVALSVAFGAACALAAFNRDGRVRLLGPPLLILAVCSLHFTGMSAVTVVADPRVSLPAGAVQPGDFGRWVAAAAALLSGLATTGALISRSSRRRRRHEKERLDRLADVALEGLMICQDGLIVSVNTSLALLIGCDPHAVAGRPCDTVLDAAVLRRIAEEEGESETLLQTATGPVPVRLIRRALASTGGRQEVIAVRDQRERLRAEERMRRLAFNDPLTELANRARFQARLEELVSAREGAPLAVLTIDLDRFKMVNDSLGHPAGDLLLARAARRMQRAAGPNDLVARLGGDEFAIIQPGCTDPEQSRALAARVVELIGRSFILEGQVVTVGASVGVARFPADGHTADALLRSADLALYKAKADGRGAFRMFESELDAQMQARRGLEAKLRRAVARQEFELHYQPLVDTATGRITGAEALIRWDDGERGLVPPSDFIPLAEETGLINNIGGWVLRTACAEAAAWPAHMSVAVNLSPAQFRDPRLLEMIRTTLAATGLAPERLELEITEGVLIADEAGTLALLNDLRAFGVRISMDDFGTGYSSLSYLRKFPFDKLKVDRSFVSQVPEDEESAAIVRAIVTMSACLGMRTTIEGVETAEQLEFSRTHGCDQIQGYLFSRPLSRENFRTYLDERESLAA